MSVKKVFEYIEAMDSYLTMDHGRCSIIIEPVHEKTNNLGSKQV